jgi:hypothetical protein
MATFLSKQLEKPTEHARHTGDQHGWMAGPISFESPQPHVTPMTPQDRAFRHRNFTACSFFDCFFAKARNCLRSCQISQRQADRSLDWRHRATLRLGGRRI